MRRTAENLDGEHWIHAAGAFFQIANVLVLGFAHAAQRGAETDADITLRLLPRVFDASVIQSEFCRGYGKLRITIEAFQTLGRKKVLGIPIQNFAGATNLERPRIKAGNPADAGFLGKDFFPEIFAATSDASDGTDSGDDRAPPAHAVTLFVRASMYAFIQRKVLLAM